MAILNATRPTTRNRPQAFADAVCYVYFMRFSVLLWLLLLILPLLDLENATTAITRGMFALETHGQLVAVAFFVILSGWVALLSARIACAYGSVRFNATVPAFFEVGRRASWVPFVIAQVPGAIFLLYTGRVSVQEWSPGPSTAGQVTGWTSFGWFSAGAAFACMAWYLTAFFYQLLRTSRDDDQVPFRAFVLPLVNWLGLGTALDDETGEAPVLARWFDRLSKWIARVGGPGYRRDDPKILELHSGHALAIILLVLLFVIYDWLGWFQMPVPNRVLSTQHPVFDVFWLASAICPSLFFLVLLLWPAVVARSKKDKGRGYRIGVAIAAVVGGVLFYQALQGQPFPVLASILILILSLCWLAAAVAFWADRFRIPVVALVAAVMVVGTLVSSDHVFQTSAAIKDTPAYPSDIVQKYLDQHGRDPIIVVTATGGGIHSASWTATVLDGLERAFATQQKSFHEHVVLMSSVSGGSVAAHYWAQRYLANPKDGSGKPSGAAFCEITSLAESSSLEDVAWGLLYPDLQRLFAWKDVLFPGLRPYDRGWALQTAFEHTWRNQAGAQAPMYGIGDLVRAANGGAAPAFAFNSTIAETGERFLISNYVVPPFNYTPCDNAAPEGERSCPPRPVPAPAFLKYYHGADLPLAMAARLSATFPYVSPVAAELEDGHVGAMHLADGGYYDDDGMATAMEFLWSAFGDSGSPLRLAGSEKDTVVVLIEIRNMEEPVASAEAPSDCPKNPALGHVVQQLGAPVGTLLNAWDVAQPLRNQREFQLLEAALANRVTFEHLTFAYTGKFLRPQGTQAASSSQKNGQSCNKQRPKEKEEADPLSWHLTALDKKRIDCVWRSGYLANAANLASSFGNALAGPAPPEQPPAIPSDCRLVGGTSIEAGPAPEAESLTSGP